MVLIILVFVVGFITMFPLKKLAQKIYNETGYNGVKGLPKFLTVLFGIVNIFLAVVISVAIEEQYYSLAMIVVAVFLLLIAVLTLVNKKAGLKDAILLSTLQTISGAIMIILLFAHHFLGGISSSGVLDILSIDESINN
ncbi:hypothetical protein [uncultured Clostridium sp.]|uniref:hypothetical protein n=1 Tax=uncultured Clostridium sp. TaxID=59620 RepID=UPI0028E23376|nr:hypothetical protein [uncultured Clostridium sp.]